MYCIRNRSAWLSLLLWGSVSLTFAQSRVDLNADQNRKAALKPGWRNISAEDLKTGAITFRNVSVSLQTSDGSPLEGLLYKGLLDFDAPLAADGITAAAESEINLSITGLTPGHHSLVSYHNEVRNVEPAEFDIILGDTVVTERVVPTTRATNDYELASAYVEFNAREGEPVVLRFVPRSSGPDRGIVINGFELDTANPKFTATRPVPSDGDEHAAENVILGWKPAPSAESHRLYFGMSSNAVAMATPASPELEGTLSAPAFASTSQPGIDPHFRYFWRVDEVDARGGVTKGDVWSFAVRHPAFPSAEGYGRFARGGRGGRVIKVTNLDDSGPGSLRAAVEAEGPRNVVFDVSGLITLESRLIIRNPDLTIAGQTAPGKGICIRKYNLGMLGAEDVIVRYLRVRPGNMSGTTLDGMGMASSDHCIIDHCSISWTLDESFSSRGAKNITLQRTLISEALNEAGHKNYPPGTQHGYAASIGGDLGSFHHNLLAHCSGRNWSLAGGLNNRAMYAGRLDLRNNVVYNWKNRATDGGAHEVNFVANYYKPGPATRMYIALKPQYGGFPGSQQYYMAGNVMPDHFDESNQEAGRRAATERGGRLPTDYSPWVDEPFFDPHVETQTAAEAYTNVLADVGCNFPSLDEHDQRVISEVRGGTFKYKGSKTGLPGLPDSQEDVGGWDDYPEIHRSADWDTDNDGMPNDWEKRAGLNPENAEDGVSDRNGDGYTNLEEYFGWLVDEFPHPESGRVSNR